MIHSRVRARDESETQKGEKRREGEQSAQSEMVVVLCGHWEVSALRLHNSRSMGTYMSSSLAYTPVHVSSICWGCWHDFHYPTIVIIVIIIIIAIIMMMIIIIVKYTVGKRPGDRDSRFDVRWRR